MLLIAFVYVFSLQVSLGAIYHIYFEQLFKAGTSRGSISSSYTLSDALQLF
jgi:hypothetical protein